MHAMQRTLLKQSRRKTGRYGRSVMSQALVARATSFGAAALLMGGAVLLALTMSFTVRDEFDFGPTPTPVVAVREPPPPPAPTPRSQTAPLEGPLDLAPLPPMQPISAEPARPYSGPIAPVGPVEITTPHWLQQPRDLTRFYPARAIAHDVEGEVLLDCLVRVSGLLDCTVISESPSGWGFADAAQRIARAHRMIPATRAGVAVEGRYAMRVPFQIE
jgi:protein TonB